MRSISNGYLAFTLMKEEPSLIDAFVRMVSTVPHFDDSDRKTLRYVKEFLIERNREMSVTTFDCFMRMLDTHRIPKPELDMKFERGQYRGSYYPIPSEHSDPQGRTKKLAKRAKKRNDAWNTSLIKYGITENQFDMKIYDRTSALGDLRDAFQSKMDERYMELEGQIQELSQSMKAQIGSLVHLQESRIDELAQIVEKQADYIESLERDIKLMKGLMEPITHHVMSSPSEAAQRRSQAPTGTSVNAPNGSNVFKLVP